MNELERVISKDNKNIRLVRDAFYGSGGFNDGSYLFRYDRETNENFNTRRNLAYYFNYTKPIVEGAVDPVFREYPTRVAEHEDERWDQFLIDVDGKGTPIDEFMAGAALEAKLDGSVFIVIDNAAESTANTIEESIERREFPYLYMLYGSDVTNYVLDRYGRLVLIE